MPCVLASAVSYLWVAGGLVVTLVLAGALAYWTSQELRRRARPPAPPPRNRDDTDPPA